jgi:hypothetical protein
VGAAGVPQRSEAQEAPAGHHSEEVSPSPRAEYARNAALIQSLKKGIGRKVGSIRRLSDEIRRLKDELEKYHIVIGEQPEVMLFPPRIALRNAIEIQRAQIVILRQEFWLKLSLENRLKVRRNELRRFLRDAQNGRLSRP